MKLNTTDKGYLPRRTPRTRSSIAATNLSHKGTKIYYFLRALRALRGEVILIGSGNSHNSWLKNLCENKFCLR